MDAFKVYMSTMDTFNVYMSAMDTRIQGWTHKGHKNTYKRHNINYVNT